MKVPIPPHPCGNRNPIWIPGRLLIEVGTDFAKENSYSLKAEGRLRTRRETGGKRFGKTLSRATPPFLVIYPKPC
ncbi:protein of unknown function [Nitrospina watsonii]|uniref:Uncharacterized protein n=1 Tax=Nitrospina watsonii TaxID=1323948 RepID=A0ABM9HG38_9BACT|nr:protein of unknown function [Nitrospina watsonii]